MAYQVGFLAGLGATFAITSVLTAIASPHKSIAPSDLSTTSLTLSRQIRDERRHRREGVFRQSLLAATVTGMLATPAIAEWRLPCIIGGCSITFVTPEYAARPVQPLNPEAALAAVNAFRVKYRRGTVVLDARLTKAAALQSETQAKQNWISHDGPGGSRPKDRAARAGYRAKIASENVASGQKSFSDVMQSWQGSAGHRENLLRPEVTAIGVAMAKGSNGRPYWTLVLGAELK
jgi:uncharacterized protein YkwD